MLRELEPLLQRKARLILTERTNLAGWKEKMRDVSCHSRHTQTFPGHSPKALTDSVGQPAPGTGMETNHRATEALFLGTVVFVYFFFIFGKCSELRSFCNSQEYLVSVNLSKKFLFLEIF